MKKFTYLSLPILLALLPLGLFLWLSIPAGEAAGPCSVPGSHPTIQAAVNDVACTTINVSAGTYNENVAITRSLSIVGAGPGSTIVDGSGAGPVFGLNPGLSVTLESLSAQNGFNLHGAGIFNQNSQLTISNTHIMSNVATANGGGLYNWDGETTVINSLLYLNIATDGGGAYSDNLLNIIDSELNRNHGVAFGGGIYNITGTVNLTGTDLNANFADMSGGGLYNLNGSVSIESSQFNNNDALIVNGGGIYQAFVSATLEIFNSTFAQNSASNDGGGVYSSGGTTTINNSTFLENEADVNGGGIANDNGGQLTLNISDILSNSAVFGGGLYNTGIISVAQTNFMENSAVNQTFTLGSGGGLYHDGTGLVERSSFMANFAYNSGGGITNIGDLTVRQTATHNNNAISGTAIGGGIASGGTLTVEASTVSSNNAIDGGGLFNGGTVGLLNSTISGNSANGGGGLQNRGPAVISFTTFVSNTAIAGGGILAITDTVYLNSDIIALNPSGGDCFASGGSIISLDFNQDSDNSCNLIQPNDLAATPPLLGPLQDNGGWTATHALMPGSPGIDDGDTSLCPSGDQRGFPRPIGPGCDIGAYEAGWVLYLPITLKP